MIDDNLIYALAIGIVVGSLIYAALRAIVGREAPVSRALAVGAYGIGLVVTWSLYQNPGQLPGFVSEVTSQGLLIVFAAIAAALAFWRRRS